MNQQTICDRRYTHHRYIHECDMPVSDVKKMVVVNIRWKPVLVILLSLWLCACQLLGSSAIHEVSNPRDESLSANARWWLAEFSNQSNQATAASALSTLLETHLRKQGVSAVSREHLEAHYLIRGTIERWNYLQGAASQPAITLRVQIHDAKTDTLLWSALGDRVGKRRESLTRLADRLLAELVQTMPINDTSAPTDDADTGVVAQADYLELISSATPGDSGHAAVLTGPTATRKSIRSSNDALVASPSIWQDRSTAFFYGADPPPHILSQFDRLVLESDNVSSEHLSELTAGGASAFAYLSVGEVAPHRSYRKYMEPDWFLGINSASDNQVLDLSNHDLREFLLEHVGALSRAGYHGLFLDAIDGQHLVAGSEDDKAAQHDGVVSLIRSIAIRHPAMRLIVNRGFEVLDDIAHQVEAVAAESLFASWNNQLDAYGVVAKKDRDRLIKRLEHARDKLNLDVIVVDYVPPQERERARQTALQIANLGFVPWVANPSLDYIGVGALEVIPRKVLMLYDSEIDGDLEATAVHTLLAMPIEYLGFVPEYLDIRTQKLPGGELKGQYAGIVSWPSATYSHPELSAWLQRQLDSLLPVAFFSKPPVKIGSTMAASMGIELGKTLDSKSAALTHMDQMFKPERALPNRYAEFGLVTQSVASGNTVHMRFKDQKGRISEPVVTGDFGGFAWQPGTTDNGLDYVSYWLLDPFKFIKTALQLPDVPQPDVTTENGKRLWLAHIDGEALPSLAELPGRQLGAELIYDQILKRYQLPHTVSIVEGEMTQFSTLDSRAHRMFDIAKRTFALEHVELASHTYSLPNDWTKVRDTMESGQHNLRIKDYQFSSEREILGSIDFINKRLAPWRKKVSLMLWSGDALPHAKDLKLVEELGLVSMNGGSTMMSRRYPSLSRVSAMARPVDKYIQVYSPVMSENAYTNNWTGPYDGFRDVIGTFELTEKPRRLKPINVNYHFYSGTKVAALKALEDVYAWSKAQDIFPLHASEYAVKVPSFRNASVARFVDGRWKLSGLGHVRSLRFLSSEYWPAIESSEGIVGARQLHDGVYLHTDGRDSVSFELTNKPPKRVFLVSSNGRVVKWRQQNHSLHFQINAEAPVVIELGGSGLGGCVIQSEEQQISGVPSGRNTTIFTFSNKDTGNAHLNCHT
ncbi:MAG: endo alpha-1,4 polygalactosaminidase [Granulosicoccus sp.]|nr:endo alpha-1,4 polygalactosaminidase [Granulosicoccus sp.]